VLSLERCVIPSDQLPTPNHRHGLSYTTFSYSNLRLSQPVIENNDVALEATITLTNTGSLPGSEVVQLYTSLPTTSPLTHPELVLHAFVKVRDLAPGESKEVVLKLDKYAVSYWEERIARWVVERGEYGVSVGPSSADLPLKANFVIAKGFEWNGL
jgi:beta-glucosidase